MLALLTGDALTAQQAPAPAITREVEPVKLDNISINAEEQEFDGTGMGSVEEQILDEPFANDLIGLSDYVLDAGDIELNGEIAAIGEPSPAERIAGENRLNLQGFPTPTMRNGFIQVGIPETLNTSQTIVIQGPMVAVLGRAAPGGIENFLTARPRTKAQTKVQSSVSSRDRQSVALEYTGPVQPKKFWQRLAFEWRRRGGPEQFATEDTRAASAALTWRHSRAASTMLSIDFRQITAHAPPGIPLYRAGPADKIAGPYLPLALFNAGGPDGAVQRRSAIAGLQFDGQPLRNLALRAGVEGWWRTVEQNRFTNSVLDLSTGLFEGRREPRHVEQPQQALAAQVEATLRFTALGAAHKLLLSASNTWGHYEREERSLNLADRDNLPADVLSFDPRAPNYFMPAFDPVLFGRINADRVEHTRYASAELGDRAAWMRGRVVVTAGLRYDEVDLRVEDRRPDAVRPSTADATRQLSYHAGVNWQVVRSRLLAFATTSTAFDPSTPVDARTGRIQSNETTLGHEAGVKGRSSGWRLDFSASGFFLTNRNIARRNPLYNDPIIDANQTQPQLVAAGAERYSGGRAEVKWAATPTVSLGLKGTYLRAITTASPDLPEEVGRPIARLPAYNVTATLRVNPARGQSGFTWGATWQYVAGYVVNYEDVRHYFLQYPGYGLLTLNTGYQWRIRDRQFGLDAGVRNALSRDLLASNARTGTGREFTFGARFVF